MIRFNVGGAYLDLPADFSIQFKKTNILFAFDNVECERSTSFDIPATPQNNRIFALAKSVHVSGEGMRRRYEAQMQAGLVTADGYLHIDEYDGGRYKAVFITGELLGLKKLRDAGKISEYYKPAGGIAWNTANIRDANTYAGQLSLAITRYLSNVQLLHPSVDLGDIMQGAYNALTGRNLPAYVRGYRYTQKELQGMPKTSVEITRDGTDADFATTPETAALANTLTNDGFLAAVGTTDTVLYVGVGGQSASLPRYIKVRQFKALQPLILTFPSSFPSDYFLMSIEDKGTTGSDPENNPLSQDWFLGDYSFDTRASGGVVASGTPLAGRSVSVPAGTPFILVSINQYEYDNTFHWNGFRYISDSDYDYTFDIEAEGESIEEGNTVRALELLPNLTLTELLKIYTYLEGKVLNYTEADGVLFDDLDVATWDTISLDGKVIKTGNVARKFGDYVQRNVVELASGSEVLENQRVKATYEIDNDNLQEEKTLAKIPFSEGQIAERDGYVVARLDAEDTEKGTLYADGIFVAVGTSTSASRYGARVTLPKNAGLQALLDASTCVTIQAWLTLLEFNQITPKTVLFYNGVRYVWTEANWSKGVATIKVAKIPV